MLNIVKIDSLKLRIPRSQVSYIDETFCEEYKKIYINSGLIEEHINLDKHKVHKVNGITTRIGLAHFVEGQTSSEQIFIQVNAKQLRSRYLEGINLDTIKDIYEYIINLGVVYVDFQTFLNAQVSDVDICYDTLVTPKTMIEANQAIYKRVNPLLYKYVGKPFRQKENIGLQFNLRDKATPSKPYVKIYHKTTELNSKSEEFTKAYLKDIDYQDIGRIEYTIKNSKHKKYLDLNLHTMKHLLEIEPSTLENVLFSGVICYLEKKAVMRKFSDLSPTDRLILYFINKYIHAGADKTAIYAALNIYEIPQERSRMKKKLTQLIEQVDDKERLVANKETMDFLRILRLDLE